MCFATISDLGKSVEVVVFPKVYAQNPGIWKQDNLVILSGKVESRDTGTTNEEGEAEHEITILADTAAEFIGPDTVLPKPASNGYGNYSNGNGSGNGHSNRYPAQPDIVTQAPQPRKAISIDVPKGTPSAKLIALNTLLGSNKGDTPANLVFYNGNTAKTLPLPYGLNWSDRLQQEIASLLKG
jgi:hypothetical protein